MKTKTASPSKKKAGTKAKKKTLSPSKKKIASPAKKKPVSSPKKKAAVKAKKKPVPSSKKKTASLAKEKLELNKQVMEFARDTFKDSRLAYFVLDTERTEDGAYILCFAIENEPGFYKLDWGWHCSYTKAKAETVLMNEKLGLAEEDVNEIIISTMGPASCQ